MSADSEQSCRHRGTDLEIRISEKENADRRSWSSKHSSSSNDSEESDETMEEAVKVWEQSLPNLADDIAESAEQVKKDQAREDAGVPQDSGWAWVCMVGCFFMHVFVGGFDRCFGVLYAELIEDLKVSSAATAGIAGVMTSLRLCCGPLAAALSNRFGTRKVAFVGGLLYASGLTLSAFRPHIFYNYLTLGVLTGFGGALLFTPAFICVNYHFTKFRSVAIGVSTAGTGLGTFVLPLFTRWLIKEYRYFGMMLILGGFSFNLVACGAVFRPVNLLFVRKSGNDKQSESQSQSPKKEKQKQKQKQKHWSAEEADEQEKQSLQLAVQQCQTNDKLSQLQTADSDEQQKQTQKQKQVATVEQDVEAAEQQQKSCACMATMCGRHVRALARVFDVHLLRDVDFLLFCITCALTNLAYQSVPVLLVHYASEQGLSKDTGADLIAIGGVADTVARAATGFIFAAPLIRRMRKYVWAADVFLLGVDILLYAFADSVWYFRVCAAVYGLTTGVYASQLTVIAADLVADKSRVPAAIGLTVFFRGVGVILGPFAAGLFRDFTGRYAASFFFCGSVAMFGSVVTSALSFLIVRSRKAAHRRQVRRAAETAQAQADTTLPV